MNKYLRAISANFINFAISTVFFLVITPVSLDVMGTEFFGLWSILNALVLLSNIGTLGISSIVNKFASEAQADAAARQLHLSEVYSAGLVIVLPMAVVTASGLVLARSFIARNIGASPALQAQFQTGLFLVALGIFPQFLARIPQGFLLSQLKNGLARSIDTVSTITLWTGATLIAFFRKDLVLISLWSLINTSLMALAYFLTIRPVTGFGLRWNPGKLKRMMSFSGYMFIEIIAGNLFQQADRIIVGLTLGPAIAGVYSVGTSVALRMSIVAGQATETMVPYASLKDSLHDHGRLLLVFRRLSRYVSLLAAFIGTTLILWMPEILTVWISPDYARRYSRVFSVLILAYGLLCLCRPAHQTMTGAGKTKITSIVYLCTTIIMLAALLVFSRIQGLLGAALANCAMGLLLVFNLYCYRFLGGRISFKDVFFDLKWGILLPGTTFFIAVLEPALWIKLSWMTVASCLLAAILINDDWARPWLTRQIKHLAALKP